jgi:hypothetical protein
MDGTQPQAERMILLCNRLAAATGAGGGVSWEIEGPDRFVWRRAEGMVAIATRDKDGQPPYELRVYSGNGVLVDELSSLLVDGDRPAPWNDALALLYRAARRSALRADELLDTLIGLLPQQHEADTVVDLR